jgi:hypothetical protein
MCSLMSKSGKSGKSGTILSGPFNKVRKVRCVYIHRTLRTEPDREGL